MVDKYKVPLWKYFRRIAQLDKDIEEIEDTKLRIINNAVKAHDLKDNDEFMTLYLQGQSK